MDGDGKLGSECDFGGLILLPAGVVGAARGEEREAAGLGHDETTLHYSASHGVEGAEAAVPLSGWSCPVYQQEHVPRRGLLEANEAGNEARREGASMGGRNKTVEGRWGRAGQEGVGRGDDNQPRLSEEKGEGVRVIGLAERDEAVGGRCRVAKGGEGEHAAVRRKMSIGKAGEGVEGNGPGSPDA
jgi:hypothetical protein